MDTPDDVIWALTQAARPGVGFVPHAESGALFAGFLEGRGYLHKSETAPSWSITPAGNALLASETAFTGDDLKAFEIFRRAV